MRTVFRRSAAFAGPGVVVVAVALGGCVEIYKGPRVVSYTDTSFYVRHIPILNGAETANEIAAAYCDKREAVLSNAYQDVPLGIRYAAFECI